jgi:hypothetical protein
MIILGMPATAVVMCLVLLFIFVYGLASGETKHSLWRASCMFVVFMAIAIGICIHIANHANDGITPGATYTNYDSQDYDADRAQMNQDAIDDANADAINATTANSGN